MRMHWGHNSGTRCSEVVLSLLTKPARSDPIGALFATRIRNLRTRLQGGAERIVDFTRQWTARADIEEQQGNTKVRQVAGPVSEVEEASEWFFTEVNAPRGELNWSPWTG